MVQQSRALAALLEDWVKYPAPTRWLTTIHNSSYWESNAFFHPQQAPHTHTHINAIHLCTQNKSLNQSIEYVDN